MQLFFPVTDAVRLPAFIGQVKQQQYPLPIHCMPVSRSMPDGLPPDDDGMRFLTSDSDEDWSEKQSALKFG